MQLALSVCDSEEIWQAAADLKRQRAYRDVGQTTGWTLERVASVYEAEWGVKGIDFHRMILERAAEGGRVYVWHREGSMVAYAAARLTRLCGDDGPMLWVTGDVLMAGELGPEEMAQIARDLVQEGRDAGATVFEVLCDAEAVDAFRSAGMWVQKATMRLEGDSRAG